MFHPHQQIPVPKSKENKVKKLANVSLVAMLSVAMIVSGCSFQSAMTQLSKYLPVALQAFNGVVTILVNAGALSSAQGTVLSADSAKVTKGFTDVEAAVADYNAADPASKSTKLTAVVAALNVVQADLGKFLPDVGLDPKNKDVIIAQSALVLLEGTLASIAVNLPNPSPAAKAAASKVKIVSAKDFKKQYNAIVVNGGHAYVAIK